MKYGRAARGAKGKKGGKKRNIYDIFTSHLRFESVERAFSKIRAQNVLEPGLLLSAGCRYLDVFRNFIFLAFLYDPSILYERL
jgi:hypothetical protein